MDKRIAEIHPWQLLWWMLSKFDTELISVKCPHFVGIKLKPHVYSCSSSISVSIFSNYMTCSSGEKLYDWTSQNLCALRDNRSCCQIWCSFKDARLGAKISEAYSTTVLPRRLSNFGTIGAFNRGILDSIALVQLQWRITMHVIIHVYLSDTPLIHNR